jgi:hypothetical protein
VRIAGQGGGVGGLDGMGGGVKIRLADSEADDGVAGGGKRTGLARHDDGSSDLDILQPFSKGRRA